MANRRRAVGVAMLLVVAGCSGAPLDGDEGFDAEVPSLAEFDYPDGYGEDGPENATRALDVHYERFAAEGGVVRATRNTSRSSYESVLRVGADRERLFAAVRFGDYRRTETYYADGTEYQWQSRSGEVYPADKTFARSVADASSPLGVAAVLNFTAADTATANGVPVVRYEATGVRADAATVDPADVESVTATLLVDETGLVHEFAYEVVIEREDGVRSFSGRYEVESIGSVRVEKPDWAEDQTLNS